MSPYHLKALIILEKDNCYISCPLRAYIISYGKKFAELQPAVSASTLSPTAQKFFPISQHCRSALLVRNKVCSSPHFIILSRPKDGRCTQEGASINNRLIYFCISLILYLSIFISLYFCILSLLNDGHCR